MGGAATLLGQGPLDASAFVLESVYPTFREAVSDRLAAWTRPLSGVGRMLTSAAIGMLRNETGVSEADLRPIARIGSVRAPIFVLSGTEDRYTTITEAESLYAHASAPKSFWAVDGAGHEDLHAFAPDEYRRRVGSFLSRLLRTEGRTSAQ